MSNPTQQIVNGVDIAQLMETIDAIREQPELASFQFRARNAWLGGGLSQTRIEGFHGAGQEDTSRSRPFTLEADEPPVLLGSNAAPNAVEAILHALAACVAVGFAYSAAAEGIEVRSLEFELEGDLDLQGFLGLSPDVRAGYDQVRLDYRVDCDAPPEKVEEICEHVQRTSPVLDILRKPVDVSVRRVA